MGGRFLASFAFMIFHCDRVITLLVIESLRRTLHNIGVTFHLADFWSLIENFLRNFKAFNLIICS
jgi:hypothetical protein